MWLTPYSRDLLDKQIVTQIIKKFPARYGNWIFIPMFITACHWSLSWARWIQSSSSHPSSLRSILILSSHLRLGLPNSLFSSGFPIKILSTFLITPMCATSHVHSILLDFIILILLVKHTNYEAPHYVLFFSLLHVLPQRSKYSPQHPVPKHPQSMFVRMYISPNSQHRH